MKNDINDQSRFISPEESRIRWLKSLEAAQDRQRFFSSGFKSHNRSAGAFERGCFYLFAARPGVGKTSFLLALAYHLALSGTKAFFLNLEMTVEQMWNRLACLHDKTLTLEELKWGERTPRRIRFFEELSVRLAQFSPFFFESSDFHDFAKAVKGGIDCGSDSVLLVDYVGLFTMRGLGPSEKYWLVSEVAKQLKLLARTLETPVIGAVQLNRKIEDRKDGKPNLADLRDSGELENHADAVFGLTRDGDQIEIDILKNRHGPTGSYMLHFDGPRAAVEEFD